MKKTVSIMTLSLLTATTLTSASPSDQMDFPTLNQSDSRVLFGTDNSNVITLEQSEMAKTEGEWITFAVGGLYGAAAYTGSYLTGNHSWDWGNFAFSVGAGVVTGGAGTFVRAYHTTKAAFFIGMGQGYYSR